MKKFFFLVNVSVMCDIYVNLVSVFLKKYFTLGGCTGVGMPIHTYKQRSRYNNSFEKIF